MAKQQGPKNIFSFRTQKEQEQRIKTLEKLLTNGVSTAVYPTLSAAQAANPPVGGSVYIIDSDAFYDVKSTGLVARVYSE